MTFTELQTAVLTRLGRPSTDGFFTATVLGDLINEAIQIIGAEALWPWLQTTTTFATANGTSEYTPPADWTYTKSLWITGYRVFTYVPMETIASLTANGLPSVYTIQNNKLQLRNIPDTIYTVNHTYYKVEPILSSGSATPVLPTQFHYAIVAKAVEIACQRINDLSAMNQASGEYDKWMRRVWKYAKRSSGPIQIKTSRTY